MNIVKHFSRPWTLLRFRSISSSIRSASSALQASIDCSLLSGVSISSIELTLFTSSVFKPSISHIRAKGVAPFHFLCHSDYDDAEDLKSYLKDVSSLKLPPSSSSDPALLAVLLWARDGGAEFGRDVAGEDCFDCALRDTVLPLSRA